MINNQTWIQAYKKAPWRRQLQLIGAYSAVLVLISIIAGTYLNVTSRAATIGRKVQKIQRDIQSVNQDIVNMETHLAQITSARIMAERAKDLGYHTIIPETAL
ncbi:MAG: hypothetical protein N2D54_00860 [Chloroflexota bacterium]